MPSPSCLEPFAARVDGCLEGGEGSGKKLRRPRAAEAHLRAGLAQGLSLIEAEFDEPTLARGQMTEFRSDEDLNAVVLSEWQLGHPTAIPAGLPRLLGPFGELNELDVAGRRIRLKALVRTPAEPVLGANSVQDRARNAMTSEGGKRDPFGAVEADRCLD